MWDSIKDFLSFLNWGWFAVVVGLAAILVALFPFKVTSFEYIASPPVLAVMVKTILIAIPTVLNVGLAAYFIYHKDLWRKNVFGAIAIHALWGMLLSFQIVSWMIKLLYSGSIGLDPNHQTDIIFAACLLLVLNFWMRTRIEVASNKDKTMVMMAQEEQLTDMSREQLQSEKLIKHLMDETETLQRKNNAQKEEMLQLRLELEKKNTENGLLKSNLVGQKWFIKKELASSIPFGEIKESKHLEIKTVKGIVVLTENEISYAKAKKMNDNYMYEVVDLNGAVYYAPVQSLRNLVVEYFTGMLLVSRMHAVMPHAILGYNDLEDDRLMLNVMHKKKQIEVSGIYFKRYKEQIIKLVHFKND